jgi:Spy/CpxP family protein refolding chaperone
VQQCKAATTPLRQADAKLLTQLALQVETAKVDPPSLQPYLSAEQNAAPNAHDVRTSALNRLHELLTSAQRNQLVDRVESQWSKTETGGASDSDSDETVEANRLNLTQAQKVRIKANFQALRANEGASPRAAMRTALESFRSDSFDATGLVPNGTRGEWAEKAAQAIVPVLTPTQRVAFANHLRTRAARESQG